jgi:hypothetical protein
VQIAEAPERFSFSSSLFDSLEMPEVLEVSPPTGVGGELLTIIGSGFGSSQSGLSIHIGATQCLETFFVSSQQVICKSPEGWDVQPALSVRTSTADARFLNRFRYRPPHVEFVEPNCNILMPNEAIIVKGEFGPMGSAARLAFTLHDVAEVMSVYECKNLTRIDLKSLVCTSEINIAFITGLQVGIGELWSDTFAIDQAVEPPSYKECYELPFQQCVRCVDSACRHWAGQHAELRSKLWPDKSCLFISHELCGGRVPQNSRAS